MLCFTYVKSRFNSTAFDAAVRYIHHTNVIISIHLDKNEKKEKQYAMNNS